MSDTKLKTVTVAHASFWYIDEDGRNRVALRGDTIGVAPEDHKRGVQYDAFVVATEEPEAAPGYDPAKATIDEVLAHVGEDQALAAEALELEKGKGDKARSTLVEKLQAIADPPQS